MDLTGYLESFNKVSHRPYKFLSVQDELAESIKELTKQLYDYTKCNEECNIKHTLPKLIVNNFDEEQIWQELELQNEGCTNNFIQTISQLSAQKDKLKFPLKLKCISKEEEKTKVHVNAEHEQIDHFENPDIKPNSDVDEFSNLSEEESKSDVDDDSETQHKNRILKKRNLKPSVVDDKFFKLAELDLFLQNEERNEGKPGNEKESLDLFNNVDEAPTNYKYSDFFENPEDEHNEEDDIGGEMENSDEEYEDDDNEDDDDEAGNDKDVNDEDEVVHESVENKKKVRFSLLDSDEESEHNNEDSGEEDSNDEPETIAENTGNKSDKIKSTLEKRQERLKHVIKKLEDEAVSEKPWQLIGEVSANDRPQNSLLEEVVDFDVSVRPAPVITEAVSLCLEDIITQRIKDKAWDDVERKVKPIDTPMEFKKKLALDQEKSKLSLAEVYEQEFIKQREAATVDETERQETEPPLHVEVRSMLHTLFNKLDALSNYHYTPRPVAPEMKIVSNVAAITMEEVAPVMVAESTLLAPQEIKGKKRKSEEMSKEERTDTDKKRARRLKKTKQRQRQREKVKLAKDISKINPGFGNKYSKLKAESQVSNVTSNNVTKMEESKEKVVRSSTSFFNKLQDEVKTQIKNKTTFNKKNKKLNVSAKKLKL